MERNYSSRPIEASCKCDINYIWLLNGEPAPSGRAICRFRSELLSECGEELFYGLVKRLKEVGEIRYEHLFVDGTKLEANANKYSFVWQKSANKYENRVLSKLETTVPALCEQYGIWPQNEEALLMELHTRCGKRVHGRGKRKSKSGFESTVTYYECEDCSLCPRKKSCTKAKGNREIQVSKNFVRQRKDSLQRITTPQGIPLRINRSIQSEGAFGILKWDYRFQRFLHRGNKKVFTEILLLAMAQNIQKYHNKTQQNRTGIQLHTKLSA